MKRWLLFVLLLGLLFATVLPVSAAGNGPRIPFNFVGKIAAVDPVGNTVTVDFIRGNKLARSNAVDSVTVKVTDTTRFLELAGDIAVPITFGELEIGDPISVHGVLVDGVWTASRITVGAKLIHFP